MLDPGRRDPSPKSGCIVSSVSCNPRGLESRYTTPRCFPSSRPIPARCDPEGEHCAGILRTSSPRQESPDWKCGRVSEDRVCFDLSGWCGEHLPDLKPGLRGRARASSFIRLHIHARNPEIKKPLSPVWAMRERLHTLVNFEETTPCACSAAVVLLVVPQFSICEFLDAESVQLRNNFRPCRHRLPRDSECARDFRLIAEVFGYRCFLHGNDHRHGAQGRQSRLRKSADLCIFRQTILTWASNRVYSPLSPSRMRRLTWQP